MIAVAVLLAAMPQAAPPAALAAPAGQKAECSRAAMGTDAFCVASDGTRIAYVDWGGEGPAIVLLAGLGNSARIFDDIAPQLARGHRVIAITRRGYGRSGDAATGDYGNARLVGDILDVMDGLGIERASFIGHSLAGGELATLGAGHADRVARLIYLDAAYDRSPVPAIMAGLPPIPGPTPADLTDLSTMTKWREGALGVRSPAIGADLAAVMRQTPDGLKGRTPPDIAGAILRGDMASPPRYAQIQAPSLALYSSKDVAEQVPAGAGAATRRAVIDYSLGHIRPWMLREKARFQAQQRCGVAYEPGKSGHYLFLERPAWLVRTVLAYLDSDEPCTFTIAPPAKR